MGNDIIRQMEKQIPEMTSAQRKVAEYIIQDTMEAAFSTIDKIAHSAGVSTASVIRLANTLEYSTFSEFQKGLKEYLRAYSAPIRKFSLNAREESPEQEGAVAEVYKCALENMSTAAKGLNEEMLEAIAHRLDQARNIYVCGVRTSESVARYLAFNLGRMLLNVKYVGESPTEQMDLFKHIGQEDVLIAITMSRYSRIVCASAAYCKEHGISVIALTDSYDSPLKDSSEYLLIAKSRSNTFHNSIGAYIFLCDVLLKLCSQISADRTWANLKLDEKIVTKMQYFLRK